MTSEKACPNGRRHQGTLEMENPPPGNEKAALAGGPLECAETEGVFTPITGKVKARFCRPVAVADHAKETLRQILAQAGTSDFALRVARTKADAEKKGRNV